MPQWGRMFHPRSNRPGSSLVPGPEETGLGHDNALRGNQETSVSELSEHSIPEDLRKVFLSIARRSQLKRKETSAGGLNPNANGSQYRGLC